MDLIPSKKLTEKFTPKKASKAKQQQQLSAKKHSVPVVKSQHKSQVSWQDAAVTGISVTPGHAGEQSISDTDIAMVPKSDNGKPLKVFGTPSKASNYN